MSDAEGDVYHDSPPTSPGQKSSPVHGHYITESNSDDRGTDSSEDSNGNASPPTSPICYVPKRSLNKTYDETQSEEVPRWKSRRRDTPNSSSDSHSSQDGDGHEVDPSHNVLRASVHLPHGNSTTVSTYDSDHDVNSDYDVNNDEVQPNVWDDSSSSESEAGSSDIHSDSSGEVASDGENAPIAVCSDTDSDEIGSSDGDSAKSDYGDHPDPFEDEISLYAGCLKTKDEAISELLDIYLGNSLSKAALADILKFHNSSLPVSHSMPRSVHYLLQYVADLSVPLNEVEHYYCRPAMHNVHSKTLPCTSDNCASSDVGLFYELPIEFRIQFLLEHRGLADLIDSYHEKRAQRNENRLTDVLDGTEYSRVWQGIFNKYKLTLILNLDGIRPHVSSKAKFWPIMFTFMEVPPLLRPSFTIVWGIWFDKEFKPNMNLFLKPFVDSLVKLSEKGGVSWQHPRTREFHVSPVRAPLLVADAPARAGALNMQEHQAKYACNCCEQKTSKLPRPPVVPGEKKQRRKRRFIFKEEPAALRTHGSMAALGREVSERGIEAKRGIKGTTVMEDIPALDLSTCVVAEYMHCTLMGNVSTICSLWFFVEGDWYIGDHLSEMSDFMSKKIHPPDFVTRLPRPLDHFIYYKANEFRSFLLYFSLAVVAPYLKAKYFQHWVLFVKASFLLLTESISEDDLVSAEAMLRLFVRDLGSLYGDDQYVYNVHQLIHLVLYTRRWGCLWSTSAFGFESFNGVLSRMIHGSKNEGKEILNQLTIAQGAQLLRNKIVKDASRMRTVKCLGKALTRPLSEIEYTCLSDLSVDELSNLKLYRRVISAGKELFSSKEYDKNFKRRNSYVAVKLNGVKKYGRIHVFCKLHHGHVLCLISEYRVVHTKFFFHRHSMTMVNHIIPVEDTGEIFVCDLQSITQKLIQVGDYLCVRPNTIASNL